MEQACQMTGLRSRDLRGMLEEGLIHAQRPAPRRYWFWAEELHLFMRFTEVHPDFWSSVKTRLMWIGRNPFNAQEPEPSAPLPANEGQRDFFS